jgi:hypothetical protein
LQPALAAVEVHEKSVVDRGEPAVLHSGAVARESLKSQAVPKLVQQHSNQIDVGSVIIIEPIIEEGAVQAARLPQVAVESGIYVLVCLLVDSREFIREGFAIPGVGKRGAAKIPEDSVRPRRAQDSAGWCAAEGIELRVNADGDAACQRRAPDVGGGLKGIESLGADSCARIASDRCDHGRVVEPFASSVGIDDDNGSGAETGRGRTQRQD